MGVFAVFAAIAFVGGGIGFAVAKWSGRLVFWLPVAGAVVFAVVMYLQADNAQGWDGIGYAIGMMFAGTAAIGWLLGGALFWLIRKYRSAS